MWIVAQAANDFLDHLEFSSHLYDSSGTMEWFVSFLRATICHLIFTVHFEAKNFLMYPFKIEYTGDD